MLHLILVFTMQLSVSAETTLVGGDAVYCKKSPSNKFEGYYALDYLAQYTSSSEMIQAASFEQVMDRMDAFIHDTIPEMYWDFSLFREGLFNSDPSARKAYIWEEAPFGLRDIHDQNLVTLLPENCREGQTVKVIPATTMSLPGTAGIPVTTVKYAPDVINELKSKNPIQLSFLVMRAFLSLYQGTVDQNRRMTFYLHTSRLEKWRRLQWYDAMGAIGMRLPDVSPPYFVSGFCQQNDPEEARRLIQSLQPNHILPGRVQAFGFQYERLSHCESPVSGECPILHLTDYAEALREDHMERLPSFMYLDGALWLISQQRQGPVIGAPIVRHLRCEIDFKTGTFGACSEFTSKTGKKLHTPFQVYVGKNCLKILSATKLAGQQSTKYLAFAFLLDM